VAGRDRCHEEATRIVPDRPNPTDSGDAADLSIPQGYLGEKAPHLEFEINLTSIDFTLPPECRHATRSRTESNARTFDKRWIFRQSTINLNGYGLRRSEQPMIVGV
jgi:hypothetical protein